MNEREFQALIRLLDDDDPGVESHVEQQLVGMGESVIPRLETAWESAGDEVVQQRIEDIIQLIQRNHTLDELRAWKERGGDSLLQGWYLISKFQFPELPYDTFKNAINRLTSKIWLETPRGANVPERLRVINRVLYRQENFRGNRRSPFDPKNYFINTLFELKKGAPISLSILYIIISQELEISLQGISVPGHFVLTYRDQNNEFYIDAFDKGGFFTRKELSRYLKEVNAQPSESYYEPISPQSIIQELLRTLITCYSRGKRSDPEKAAKWEALLRELKS